MGLPCVVYDLPSHREIFGDTITRVPIGDTRAFAGAIADHIERLESDTVRQARHDIARAYSIEECAARRRGNIHQTNRRNVRRLNPLTRAM